MPLLNVGRDLIASLLIGETVDPLDNSNARLVVGDGDDAFDETHSALQGQNTSQQGMEIGYPQRSSNTLSFRSLFGTAQANHAWEEWGVDNGATLLNRQVESLGEKTSAQSWQFDADVEIENADAV